MLGVTGITTLGGAFFAWLFVRWNDNLWVPIGVHLFLNAWWELFAVSQNAIGNWEANGARPGNCSSDWHHPAIYKGR